jgi:hypothetical protein
LPDLRRTAQLVWLVAAGCVGSAAAGAAPLDTVRECAAKASAEARGLSALVAQCPGLDAALADLGYTELLPADWQKKITGRQLVDLAALADRYAGEKPSTAPDVGMVRAITERLAADRAGRPKSLWERFEDWFRSLFSDKSEKDLSWLGQWLKKLDTIAGLFSYVTFGLLLVVVVGAVAYLIIELRALGIFSRATAGPGARSGGVGAAQGPLPPPALESVPIVERPALLLARVVRSLARSGRLTAERHLTHRELPRAARLEAAASRTRLAQLAAVAEEVLYAPHAPAASRIEAALSEGEALLREFDAAEAAT